MQVGLSFDDFKLVMDFQATIRKPYFWNSLFDCWKDHIRYVESNHIWLQEAMENFVFPDD